MIYGLRFWIGVVLWYCREFSISNLNRSADCSVNLMEEDNNFEVLIFMTALLLPCHIKLSLSSNILNQ